MRRFHNLIARILVFLVVTALANCGGGGAPSVGLGNMANVQVAMHMQGQSTAGRAGIAAILLPGVQSVTITISGVGFTTIIDSFNATPGLAVTRAFQIPVGAVATFNVQGFNTLVGVPSAPVVNGSLTQSMVRSIAPVVVNIPLVQTAPVVQTGQFLYVNDNVATISNTVSGFVINQTTGVLSAMPGSPFSTGGLGDGGFFARNNITLSTARNFLFATNSGDNNVAVFSIDPATGVLTAVAGSPFTNSIGAIMSGSGSAVVNQSGTLLFVGNRISFDISVFSIAANGALTSVVGSPFSAIHSNGIDTFSGRMDGIRLNDSGTLLYGTASSAVLGVGVFSVAANGVLSPLAGSPFTGALRGATSIDLDAASGIAIGAATGGRLTSYTVNAAGAVTAINQTSTGTTQFRVNLFGNQQCGEFTPDGSKYITSGGSTAAIGVVNVSASGQLTDATGSSFVTTHPTTGYSAIHPNGLWVYATEKSATTNVVEFFTMAANGVLTSQQLIVAGARGSHNGVVIY